MKVSRIYRLLRLITMLQTGRTFTSQELADELDVSRRTVFRDLNALELARIPYYYCPEAGGYRISRHFFLPPVNLTLTEALAILGLSGRVRTVAHDPLRSEAAKAAVKLESFLPRHISEYVGSVLEKLTVQPAAMSEHDGSDATFNDLARATVDKLQCKLTYRSFYEGGTIRTTIRPLRLIFVERAWYVIAWSQMHRENRTFKLVRIEKLTVSKTQFATPAEVNLDEYFGDAWQMIPEGKLWGVHVRFEPKVAGNVAEVRWHRNQRVEWNDDGSMDFHVTVDGLGEISWWLLGYGDQVTVIAPSQLRQRVATAAKNMVARYEPGNGRGSKRPKSKGVN
ncbi:MAG: helix-turn-helix transcriptional regulator [Planctomycetota bacterium]|jgi:proteasome accessory factor B